MVNNTLFTSESVSEGHPDKVADQISDAVLDAVLAQDREARVACDALVKTGLVFLVGEMSTSAQVDFEAVVRRTVQSIGYDSIDYGFDFKSCAVMTAISRQSPDIAQGVGRGKSLGAGDQGLMFGFATNETAEYMPAPLVYAHQLVARQAYLRKNGCAWLRPDAKSQVTVQYQLGKPIAVDSVVLSTQHDPEITLAALREYVVEEIIRPVFPVDWIEKTQFHINPTGRFVLGGPAGDSGLTGRKIIVDSYGGMARHGGGAFSGKDPTKVDRSAAYMARYVAKNIVAAGVADRCELQLSYAIGISEPMAVSLNTFGTGLLSDETLTAFVKKHFSFAPAEIIETLDLWRPIYQKTAAYGHFGRDLEGFPWERLDKVELFKQLL
eukprot:TRINITY_DN9617_c0_g1_i2.p2 TRINITY_DN9617_c0_g1~~TRINITY_DN9617_c0_g1_i2.p2  ORF type:complete len:381 (+),score=-67.50 TRINITY_DN9617_c0_g1_i2:320-1462(+)